MLATGRSWCCAFEAVERYGDAYSEWHGLASTKSALWWAHRHLLHGTEYSTSRQTQVIKDFGEIALCLLPLRVRYWPGCRHDIGILIYFLCPIRISMRMRDTCHLSIFVYDLSTSSMLWVTRPSLIYILCAQSTPNRTHIRQTSGGSLTVAWFTLLEETSHISLVTALFVLESTSIGSLWQGCIST